MTFAPPAEAVARIVGGQFPMQDISLPEGGKELRQTVQPARMAHIADEVHRMVPVRGEQPALTSRAWTEFSKATAEIGVDARWAIALMHVRCAHRRRRYRRTPKLPERQTYRRIRSRNNTATYKNSKEDAGRTGTGAVKWWPCQRCGGNNPEEYATAGGDGLATAVKRTMFTTPTAPGRGVSRPKAAGMRR